MSSRVLKKLHGDNDLELCDPDVSDVDNDIGAASKMKFDMNRYEMVRMNSVRFACAANYYVLLCKQTQPKIIGTFVKSCYSVKVEM